MDKVLFSLGNFPVTVELALYAGGGLIALLLATLLVVSLRQSAERRDELARHSAEAEVARAKAADLEGKLAGMLQGQYEMNARMQTMAQIFGDRTSDLMRSVNERIDAQGQRGGLALQETNTKTSD